MLEVYCWLLSSPKDLKDKIVVEKILAPALLLEQQLRSVLYPHSFIVSRRA